MNRAITVRRLAAHELDLAVSIVTELKASTTAGGESSPRAALALFFAHPDNVLLAALDENRPVGFALAYVLSRIDRTEPMLYLHEIEVLQSHRRRGIGRRLMQSVIAHGRRVGCLKSFLATYTANVAAIRLFESTGFVAHAGSCIFEQSLSD